MIRDIEKIPEDLLQEITLGDSMDDVMAKVSTQMAANATKVLSLGSIFAPMTTFTQAPVPAPVLFLDN